MVAIFSFDESRDTNRTTSGVVRILITERFPTEKTVSREILREKWETSRRTLAHRNRVKRDPGNNFENDCLKIYSIQSSIRFSC